MTASTRNLIIFSVVTLGAGWAGVLLDQATGTAPGQPGLGMLVWLVAPLATGLLLRAFGGDGWRDVGFRPHLPAGWRWYAAALVGFPLLAGVMLVVNAALGLFAMDRLAGGGAPTLAALIGGGLVGAFIKNLFEEFAWRGYLTPRLAATKLHSLLGHLLTGLVWGGWHLPYWFVFLQPAQLATFTTLSAPAFAAVGFVILTATAITYGELRLLSGSTWPAVVLHTVANAVTAALLTGGFYTAPGLAGVVFSPGNDGLLGSALFTLAGLGLYAYRARRGAVAAVPNAAPVQVAA